MAARIVLPGIGGSDEAHWQSHWEATDSSFRRFLPRDWDRPDLADWESALEAALDYKQEPFVLIAHSLACLLVVHAAERIADRVCGAFLVAVPDPESPAFPVEAPTFRNAPSRALPFSALIVASSNDPYAAIDYARQRAREWDAGIVEIGPHGHINAASALGAWKEGRMLLDAFCAGLRA